MESAAIYEENSVEGSYCDLASEGIVWLGITWIVSAASEYASILYCGSEDAVVHKNTPSGCVLL